MFTDLGHTHRTELSNGVLIQQIDPTGRSADLTVTLTKPELLAVLGGGRTDELAMAGDVGVVARLLGVLDPVGRGFAIVTA